MTDIAARMAITLDWLCRAIAARGGKDRTITPLIVLVWGRVRRAAARLDRLLAQYRAGTLPPPRKPRAPRPELYGPPAPPPNDGKLRRLPGGFGWLAKLSPETRAFGTQLEHLLTDPEMAAFVAAAPQAGRLLRPLFHMLGVKPAANLLPPPPARTRRPRPRRPSPPPQPRPGKPLAARYTLRPPRLKFQST